MTQVEDASTTPAFEKIPQELVNERFAHIGSMFSKNFLEKLEANGRKLLHVKTKGLWTLYLEGFTDPQIKQSINCNCCRDFIRKFGGLCYVNDTGKVVSALWEPELVEEPYKTAVGALKKRVEELSPISRFWALVEPWGKANTGGWHHYALPMVEEFTDTAPKGRIGDEKAKVEYLKTALKDFTLKNCEAAMHVLASGGLNQSKKFAPQIQFLIDLHRSIEKHGKYHNQVVKAAGFAPPGFATPRTNMVGTLIEWVREGRSGHYITREWNSRVRPEVFGRPVAAPTAGNIVAGEKLIEKMGLTNSLKRRLASFDEIKAFAHWVKPEAPVDEKAGGVFGHLKAKDEAKPQTIEMPAEGISLNEFLTKIVPKAKSISVYMPNAAGIPWSGFCTAVDEEAPPILNWDYPQDRNRFSAWTTGAEHRITPGYRGLTVGWVEVTGIFPPVNRWTETGKTHHADMSWLVTFPGQTPHKGLGQCLFPNTLIGEMHEIRATIEAYSNNTPCPNPEETSALGIMITKGARFRIDTEYGTLTYTIDYVEKL